MTAPLYAIPGAKATAMPEAAEAAVEPTAPIRPRSVADVLAESKVESVLDELERDLIGLVPVKSRIRDIAALLVIDKLRAQHGLAAQAPSLHMCFTGNPGTGKTTVAMRMAKILHSLGYVRKGHVVSVTRDDLVGQYIGHTAPKTKEVLKKAMGGVLFIDEAYYLYRPDNERDYGQEAIEILLQVMENQRDDLVVILAGYKDRMNTFFQSNPGMSSRIAHHLDFPDYDGAELLQIAGLQLESAHYRFGAGAREAFDAYLQRRIAQPHFANARSVRNALDRARLRQASRLYADRDSPLTAEALSTLAASDILASRVFTNEPPGPGCARPAPQGTSP
ncbi:MULTISPECIES: CbbX protein [unclassified Variovorax]|uniref:CbbX protein n=1 Tax=unclassified Variovorax TaxID=663243 RepID=UPI001BD5E5BE|nr:MULTISPECIES: CbbX protein [unclassified Variovorax]